MMLMQIDPFRDVDAWFDRMIGRSGNGQRAMPMDAYRRGNDLWVHIDLPGVSADSVDVNVERNVLTVSAQRTWQPEEGDQVYFAERHRGTYRRQVSLGEGLDAEAIEANYQDGVLTLRIPIAEKAQPRKVAINTGSRGAIDTSSSEQITAGTS